MMFAFELACTFFALRAEAEPGHPPVHDPDQELQGAVAHGRRHPWLVERLDRIPERPPENQLRNDERRRASDQHRALGRRADIARDVEPAVADADDANPLVGKLRRLLVIVRMQVLAAEVVAEHVNFERLRQMPCRDDHRVMLDRLSASRLDQPLWLLG